MSDKVKIEVMSEESKELMALFASTGIPSEIEFSFRTNETTNEKKLNALDLNSNLNFCGNDSMNKNSNYYLGIRDKNTLRIHLVSIYRMEPIIKLNEDLINSDLSQTPLTFKEQLNEMKEKFGSRKTQRSLASKRKYAIEFGEEDVEHIEAKTQSVLETSINQIPAEETNAENNIDILPKQKRDAICVQEVYDINEIILENERNILLQLETELFGAIDNSYIKELMTNSNDLQNKLIAIYINLILQTIALKAHDLKKADPLPTLSNEVKVFLFERYISTQPLPSNKLKSRYVLTDKQKDRLLIYGIILSFMLYNYRPIKLESLQTAFKVPQTKLKRIVEIIGGYIENIKNTSGINVKFVVFKIPLNTFKESKKRFDRTNKR